MKTKRTWAAVLGVMLFAGTARATVTVKGSDFRFTRVCQNGVKKTLGQNGLPEER